MLQDRATGQACATSYTKDWCRKDGAKKVPGTNTDSSGTEAYPNIRDIKMGTNNFIVKVWC